MAGLFVVMAVMAIFLTVAVQSAIFQAQREKEEELIFRGQQAVEAIRLFRARNGRFPLTLDELVKAKPRVLRKPWADPMTTRGARLGADLPRRGGGHDGWRWRCGADADSGQGAQSRSGPRADHRCPFTRVHRTIKVYEGRTKYCEWKFFFDPQKQTGPGKQLVPGPTPRPPKDD